jgi:hypothetical protein
MPLSPFFLQPVQRILATHIKESPCNGLQEELEPGHHSVTSVAFLNDTMFASAGASDGTIKFWDLRKTSNFFNVPSSVFTHGFFFSLAILDFLRESLHSFSGRASSVDALLSVSAGNKQFVFIASLQNCL